MHRQRNIWEWKVIHEVNHLYILGKIKDPKWITGNTCPDGRQLGGMTIENNSLMLVARK